MQRNELTALIWNLQREYLEFDPKVEIHFRGVEFGYGRIEPKCLTGQQPEPAALRLCAAVNGRDIHSTDLRVVSVDGTTIGTRTINWGHPDRRREAIARSKRELTVYFQGRCSGKLERLISWEEVQHLLVTDSEIYLGDVCLAIANTRVDDFDFTILVDDREIPADQFHWLRPSEWQILEALLHMQESVYESGYGLTPKNGFEVLVEDTERWAAVVREFIGRYGRPQAVALLGRDALENILARRGTAFALMPTGNTTLKQQSVTL